MHDFYASSRPAPLDQADGLRRMFAGRRRSVLPLVANPYAPFSGVVLDRLAAV
jgi:flagellar biosynthesis protein FlhG